MQQVWLALGPEEIWLREGMLNISSSVVVLGTGLPWHVVSITFTHTTVIFLTNIFEMRVMVVSQRVFGMSSSTFLIDVILCLVSLLVFSFFSSLTFALFTSRLVC